MNCSDKTGTLTKNPISEDFNYRRKFSNYWRGFKPKGEILLDGKPLGDDDLSKHQNNLGFRLAQHVLVCVCSQITKVDGQWQASETLLILLVLWQDGRLTVMSKNLLGDTVALRVLLIQKETNVCNS